MSVSRRQSRGDRVHFESDHEGLLIRGDKSLHKEQSARAISRKRPATRSDHVSHSGVSHPSARSEHEGKSRVGG
jgi:hypothetical protein